MPHSQDQIQEIFREFKTKVPQIFGSNLHFAFIFGGFAKDYATTEDHDVDIFICCHEKNTVQEIQFREFYFALHKKYGLTPDHNDPGEIATLDKLQRHLDSLRTLKITPVISSYAAYEAIVWGDIFSSPIKAEVGNLALLSEIQAQCAHYPQQWRDDILTFLSSRKNPQEMQAIHELNVTRLFRRHVIYLKKDSDAPQHLHACILGGGGNVAEAVAAHLLSRGHRVSQFRFSEPVTIPGVPQRPPRSKQRLNRLAFKNESGQPCSLQNGTVPWISPEQFHDVDVFLFAFPSYMAEPVGDKVGAYLAGRPIINLSDRFLGSFALMQTIKKKHGVEAMPRWVAAFNGVPIMALKAERDAPTTIYYVKPAHSIAWYPQNRDVKAQTYRFLMELFGFKESQLKPYQSMLHLAFENAHCIEHAVVDLENLNRDAYQAGRHLYSPQLYTEVMIARMNTIITERDRVAERVLQQQFTSLSGYDQKIFGTGAVASAAVGTSAFRIQHPGLSKAPSLLKTTAFGYEDIGWSLVTLESVAKYYGISVPEVTRLIEEWNAYSRCDYRVQGRTLSSLDVINTQGHLCWPSDFFDPYSHQKSNVISLFWKSTKPLAPAANKPTAIEPPKQSIKAKL